MRCIKERFFLIFIFYFLFSCTSTTDLMLVETGDVRAAVRRAPFSKGVNFSAWFETNSASSIPFTKYTEQDFIDAKSLGVDVIRLPVRMHSMTSGAPNYTIDPLLFRFLDIVVEWAEKHELYLIIDNHSFDPILPTSPDVDRILLPVWTQIARRYRDRSSFIIYEILNEPHGIADELWGEIQGRAIAAIRQIDQNRLIIVGGTDYNSIGKLSALPRYADANLIYTFHFYDPHVFTHQGATWGLPSLASLRGVPFPFNSQRMPSVPNDLRGTWVEGNINHSYERDSRLQTLSATLDRVVSFSLERDVPVFCGEFGVYIPNSRNDDRVRWYSFVTSALDRRNISRTSWDYYGGFGIFTEEDGEFNHDLNIDIVRALRFNVPPQTRRNLSPLDCETIIFDDYPNTRLVTVSSWGENIDFSLYDTNSPLGEFSIRWGNALQYQSLVFNLKPRLRNLSYFAGNGYVLEFKARTQDRFSFDVRFLNSGAPPSIPWRKRFTVDENILPADGLWHTIRIPLAEMREHGAWINESQRWMEPRGAFSWEGVFMLEFVSEYADITNKTIRFDDIRITN